MFSGKKLIIKSDSIDVKEENDELITTLTLTGLKKKDTDTRDFVGEIASYQDDLIKISTSPFRCLNNGVHLIYFIRCISQFIIISCQYYKRCV